MNLLGSRRPPALPGRHLTVRAHRNLASLLARIRPGDLVVIDLLDLDAETARALVDRKPGAVLNAAQYISGRYANLGPQVLVRNGVTLLEGRREQVLALRDGMELRLEGQTLFDGLVVVLDVVEVSAERISEEMERAQSGLAVQLDSFAHAASEFVRREEGLLLHGAGAPPLQTRLADRAVVVVGPGAQTSDLKRLRRFLRTARPVLIGVDAGIERLAERRLRTDIAVLSGASQVSDKALRRSRDVVLARPGQTVERQVEKLNLPVLTMSTGAAPADIGLLLAHHGGARVVVPVGSPATIEEFIDRDRNDQASNVLTRLRLGARVVEGSAVPAVQKRQRRLLRGAVAAAVVAALVGFGFTGPGGRLLDRAGDRLPDGLGNSKALDEQKAAVADRDRQLAQLRTDLGRATSYSLGTAGAVVGGTLTGRSVALVVLPGADPDTVSNLRSLIGQAGAAVTAEVTVNPLAVTPSEQALVAALTGQMLTQATDVKVAAGSTGAQQLGALIARAAAVPSSANLQKATYDPTAVSIASGLQTAEMVTAKVTARAALTLVVTGPVADGPTDTLLAAIVGAYGAAVPTVVSGNADHAGVVGVLRDQTTRAFSLADGSSTIEGQVAAVLALAARTRGTIGDYGTAGADGLLPPR